MQPLYYFAGRSGPAVARAELPHVFDDVEPIGFDVADGPENSGFLVYAPTADGAAPDWLGYFPQRQTWTQLGPGVWIGVDDHLPPTPADLVRRKTFAGHAVTLADGREWLIPVVRRPGGSTNLPQRLGWDFATKKFGATLDERYRDVWERTAEAVDVFFNREKTGGSITLERACELAVDALRLNYRIGPAEASLLGLLDTTNWEQALGAVVDLPTFLEIVADPKPEPA